MVIFRYKGGIGDEICVTAVIREFRRQFPDEMIRADLSRMELVRGNPHLNIGNKDNGVVVNFQVHQNEHIGNHGHSYAIQLADQLKIRFKLVDTTPELFLSEDEIREAWDLLEREKIQPEQPLVTLCTQATWANRCWSRDLYDATARLLRKDGVQVVEVGHGGQPLDGATLSLMSKLSLRQTAAVMNIASCHIGNDSGLSHLAASASCPQVTLYSVKRWYTRSYWNTTPVFSYSDCMRLCEQSNSYCARRIPGSYDILHCMNEISVPEVIDAVRLSMMRFPRRQRWPGVR